MSRKLKAKFWFLKLIGVTRLVAVSIDQIREDIRGFESSIKSTNQLLNTSEILGKIESIRKKLHHDDSQRKRANKWHNEARLWRKKNNKLQRENDELRGQLKAMDRVVSDLKDMLSEHLNK